MSKILSRQELAKLYKANIEGKGKTFSVEEGIKLARMEGWVERKDGFWERGDKTSLSDYEYHDPKSFW